SRKYRPTPTEKHHGGRQTYRPHPICIFNICTASISVTRNITGVKFHWHEARILEITGQLQEQ
ncbi:hypothetical protein L9F63_003951, partial [Diploptera punctata]